LRLRDGELFGLAQVDQLRQTRQPGVDQRRKPPEPALVETDARHDRNQYDTGQREGKGCLDLTLPRSLPAPSSDRTRLVAKG